MHKIFLKLFIKDYQNKSNLKVRTKYGTLSGVVGIISNLILCMIKIILGILTASVSILADGINNLTDAGSSIITLVGFKLSSAPADDAHPYGHERIEYITGMIISFLILIIGFTLGKESIMKIINHEHQSNITLLTFIIMILSIIIKFWQSLFYRGMSKEINSETLKASAKDSLNDCISTTAVLIGLILLKLTGLYWIDGVVGILVAILIFVSGIKMVIETMNPLIGSMPSAEEVKQISDKILSYDGILGIHDLVIHRYGSCTAFATVHIEVDCAVDVLTSHDIIDNIERDVKETLNIQLTAHLDPIDTHNPETKKLHDAVVEMIHHIDPNLSIHDFRVVHGTTHTNLLFDVTIPHKFKISNTELRELIASEVKKIDETYFVIMNIDFPYTINDTKY